MQTTILKPVWVLVGSALAFFQPVWMFFLLAFLAVIGDCFTAYRLSNRIKKTTGAATGKFRSDRGRKIFWTMIKISYLIAFAYMLDLWVFNSREFISVKCVIGAFTFIQAWSILENESSGSNRRWAVLLQKIMVDKTERHLDIDLSALKQPEETTANNEQP